MIEIGLPTRIFRAMTLGLYLGDEIGIMVDENKIVATARSSGTISAGIVEVGKDTLTELRVDEDLPFEFGISTARLAAFAKGCKAEKGSTSTIRYEDGDVIFKYKGGRYRYLKVKAVELGWSVGEFVENIKGLCRSMMEKGIMVTVPTKYLKQSLGDIRKYMKSGEAGFVVEGDRILFEGADEITKFGFGLTNITVTGNIKKMTVIFSIDILKDLINAMVEAGDTANVFIVDNEHPVVFQVPVAGGEALYATMPRA